MRHRNLHLAMLGFMCFWFGIVVPGHERGLIKTPGSPVCESAMSCGPAPAATTCCPTSDPSSQRIPPKEDQSRNCALCDYLGTLLTPPVVEFMMSDLGLVELLPFPPGETPHFAHERSNVGGRSPPVV